MCSFGKLHCDVFTWGNCTAVCSLGEDALQCVHLEKMHCDVFSEGNVLHYNAFLVVVKVCVGWVGA